MIILYAILTLVLLIDRSICLGVDQPIDKKLGYGFRSGLVPSGYGVTLQFNIGTLAPGQETRVDIRLTRF